MAQFVPVDHDPFAGAPAADAAPAERVRPNVTVYAPYAKQPQLVPVDHDPFAGAPGVAEDVAKAIPSGLVKGTIGMATLPDTISKLWATGGDAVLDQMEKFLGLPQGWAEETKGFIRQGRAQGAMKGLPSYEEAKQGVETVTGPLYDPKTRPGKFAGTAAEFIPGAGRKIFTMAILPGLSSEGAGQYFEGTKLEAPARITTALATAGAGSLASRASSSKEALRANMAPQVTDEVITKAERLIADAEARGVRLTWPEAIEQVAPGSGLPNVQRLLESSADTRGRMDQFFAERPAQFDRAAGQVFDNITPAAPNPSAIGPTVGRAAQGEIDNVRGEINRATRPYYDAARAQRIPPDIFQIVKNDPVFKEGLALVRKDPWIGPTLKGLPDDSVAVIDAIKKQLDATGTSLRTPGSGTPVNNFSASIVDTGKDRMVAAADFATGSMPARASSADRIARTSDLVPAGRPAQFGAYEQARFYQEKLREKFLQPLLDGPLGSLAKKDMTTQRAIEVLFPREPLANSQHEISQAVSALARRHPYAAQQLVRAHAEATFNSSTRNLQGGANQRGAANFAKDIAGNAQQAANLEAAVRALPNGNEVWAGFSKFLEIAEASGKRQHIGSRTAFNASDLKDLGTGGKVANAAKIGASPARWASAVSDAVSRWQLGRNLEQLAAIITDPKAGHILRSIASEPQTSDKALVLAWHVVRSVLVAKNTATPSGEANKP